MSLGTQRTKVWKSYEVILSFKTANFLNQWDTNSCISLQVHLVTTVVALVCSKSRGPSTSGNCSGFCKLSNGIFPLHLGKDVGMAKNDIIIGYSLMATKLSPSITTIVRMQCDLPTLPHSLKYSSHSLMHQSSIKSSLSLEIWRPLNLLAPVCGWLGLQLYRHRCST